MAPIDGSDFNYDYQVSLDADRGQAEYNYRAERGLLGGDCSAEMPADSRFLREGDELPHPFLLRPRHRRRERRHLPGYDALGRQEDWEESKGGVAPVRAATRRSPAE